MTIRPKTHAPASSHDIAVFLLGGFRVAVDGLEVPRDAWQQRRATDLVKLLALAPRHRLHREQVIDALWPGLAPNAGAANLRKAVHYARRALGFDEAISITAGMVELALEASVSVDIERFEHEAAAALRTGNPADAARAAELHTGALLPEDPYEPWLDEARDRLRLRHLQTLRAARLWDRVAELDPVDEEAHRALITADLTAGNRQGALRRFERLREILQRELGVTPDARSLELYRQAQGPTRDAPPTPADRTASLLASALLFMHRGDLNQAERDAAAARELAVHAGLGRALGEASTLLGMVAHRRGNWREIFLREFLDAVKKPPSLGAPVFEAHLCIAEVWLYGADGIVRGEAFARELIGIAEEHGSPHGRAVAALILGEAALLAGRLDAAETQVGSAVALHQTAGAVSGWALSLSRLAEVALARHDHGRTSRILIRARDISEKAPLSSHLIVRVLGTQIEAARTPAEGARAVREAEEILTGREICEPCSLNFRAAAAVACARAGQLEAAHSYLEATRRVAGMWQGGPSHAAEWEARAALRSAEGNHSQASALLHEAADLFARSGHTLAAARCLAAADARNVSGTPAS